MFREEQLTVYKVGAEIHLGLPIPELPALCSRQACMAAVYLQKAFLSHSPHVDLSGNKPSVDTKPHPCMFHKLQDKEQLEFLFQLSSPVVSAEHAHTQSHSTEVCVLSAPISSH